MNKILFTLTIFCATTAHGKPARVTTKDGLHSAELSEKAVACSGNFLQTLVENDLEKQPTISLDVIETPEELDLFAHHLNQLAAIQDAYPKATDDELRKQLAPSLQKLPLPTLACLVKHTDFYGVPHLLATLEQALVTKIDKERVPLAVQLSNSSNQSWLATVPERARNEVLAQAVIQRHPLVFFGVEQNPQILQDHTGWILSAQFSLDGSKMVTAPGDSTACVWQQHEGQWVSVATLQAHTNCVLSAQFSPDGSKIVTASYDRTARVWQQHEGEWVAVATLQGHTDWVRSAQFSPDGSKIVTASADRTARVWQQHEQGEWVAVATLQGHTGWILSARFSPEGTKIVTASDDRTARVWQQHEQGQWVSVATLGHTNCVQSAQFSPDGSKMVTALDDRTARVWQQNEQGQWTSVATLQGHTYWVNSTQFSPDGSKIVTASADRTVRVWDVLDVISRNQHAGLVLTLQDVLPALQRLEQCGDDAPEKESLLRGLIEKINARKTT